MTGRGWLGIVLLLLVVGAGVLTFVRAEGGDPTIGGPESLAVGKEPREVELVVADDGSGLRRVSVVLAHANGEAVLVEESYPGGLWAGGAPGEERIAVTVDAGALGLPANADAFLRVSVRDWSWRGALSGNETLLEIPVRIDQKPPRVTVATGLTYVTRGGAGAVVYRLGEETVRDGVEVGEAFFPGYPLGGEHVAIFAVPTNAPGKPVIRVVAEDPAGNVARASWPVVVKERRMPEAQITLPQTFLDSVVRDLADAHGIEAASLADAFREINTDLRRANEARIREIVTESAGEPLWDGSFEQQPNSQVTSRFAEQRRYFVGGRKNSEATHYGYDLASTAAAPITATASGRVLYADDLGIYGNCVLIDHGLGVTSLYGHLSRIDVARGDVVSRGQQLGLSGATGLAGGDHLHFAILVGTTYVDPLEWWDPEWLRTHVTVRLPRGS